MNRIFVCIVVALLAVSCEKGGGPTQPSPGPPVGGNTNQIAPAPGTTLYEIPIPGQSVPMLLAITAYSPTDKNASVSVGDEVWAEFEAVGPTQTIFVALNWREEGKVQNPCSLPAGFSTYFLHNKPDGARRRGYLIRENTRNIVGLSVLVIFKDQLPLGEVCNDFMAEEPFNYRTPAGSR